MDKQLERMHKIMMEYHIGKGYLIEDALPEDGGADPNAAGGADPMAGGADPNAAGGADPMAGGTDPNAAGGADPNAQQNVDTGLEPQGGENANADMAAEEGGMDTEGGMEEEEEVEEIDVEELTDSQESTEKKVKKLNVSFKKLLDKVESLDKMIDKNNQHLEDFMKEFEKRIPTSQEKITMRQQKSAPFDTTIEDNIAKMPSNYSPEKDLEDDSSQYEITKQDIDDISDWARISKSLDEREKQPSLRDMLGY